MLSDYIPGIEYLPMNQNIVLINKNLKKQEETIQNSLKEMEERHRKTINALHEKYEIDIIQMKDEIDGKIQQIIMKMDISKL